MLAGHVVSLASPPNLATLVRSSMHFSGISFVIVFEVIGTLHSLCTPSWYLLEVRTLTTADRRRHHIIAVIVIIEISQCKFQYREWCIRRNRTWFFAKVSYGKFVGLWNLKVHLMRPELVCTVSVFLTFFVHGFLAVPGPQLCTTQEGAGDWYSGQIQEVWADIQIKHSNNKKESEFMPSWSLKDLEVAFLWEQVLSYCHLSQSLKRGCERDSNLLLSDNLVCALEKMLILFWWCIRACKIEWTLNGQHFHLRIAQVPANQQIHTVHAWSFEMWLPWAHVVQTADSWNSAP